MRAHAVLLDVTHRLLVVDGAPFAVDVPDGERPLRALELAAPGALGCELPFSLGQRVEGGDAWFAFVDDQVRPPAGERVPIEIWAAQGGGAWALYVDVLLGGWRPPTTRLDVWHFGNEPRLASQLAHCVIKGIKRATASWVALARHEGWTDLAPGTVSIVTDGFGIPLCAIETTRVDRVRFGDVTPAFAAAEGEGDASLADWRAGHQAYYDREAARIGLPFTDDAELDLSHFRVLKVFERA
jgi:uncharacterized protein YhfF